MQLRAFVQKHKNKKEEYKSELAKVFLTKIKNNQIDMTPYIMKIEKIENKIAEAADKIEKYYQKLEILIKSIQPLVEINSTNLHNAQENLLEQSNQQFFLRDLILENQNNSHFLSKTSFFQLSSQKSREQESRMKSFMWTKLTFLNQKINEISDQVNEIEGIKINLALQAKVTKYISEQQLKMSDSLNKIIQQNLKMNKKLNTIQQKQIMIQQNSNNESNYTNSDLKSSIQKV